MARIPREFRHIKDLGDLVAIYPLRRAWLVRAGSVLLAVSCAAAGLVVLGNTGLQALDRYYRHGPAVVMRGAVLPLLLAFLLFALALYILLAMVRLWKKCLVLYVGGLAYTGYHGTQSYRWDQVASLRGSAIQRTLLGFAFGNKASYSLITTSGQTIQLESDLAGIDEAVDAVREKLVPLLYERYHPGFASGQGYLFGPIGIQKSQGITIRQLTLPWTNLRSPAIKNGELRIPTRDAKGKDRVYSIPVSEIPNLDLLMAFLAEMQPAS